VPTPDWGPMANEAIQTTTGTAAPEELGRTLIYEHVLVENPRRLFAAGLEKSH